MSQERSASQSTKRKHKTLTLCDKKEIVERLEKGEKMSELARLYGVGRSTIYDIRQNGDRIIKFIDTAGSSSGKKRHTLKSGEFPEVDNALYSWYLEERTKRTHISGEKLRQKANFFYRTIHKNTIFRASDGWLDKFKKRFGIRKGFLNTPAGEKPDLPKPEKGTTFQEKIIRKVEEMSLTPGQIYIANESVLFPRTLSFTKIHEENNTKRFNDRLTLMPCANTIGTHKLQLMVVGKIERSRVFQNTPSLPVVYKCQAEARITREVFSDWLNDCFIPEVKSFSKRQKSAKALLVLDNAPPGGTEEELMKSADGSVQVIFAPHDCGSQGENVLERMQMYYKQSLLHSVINQEQSVNAFLESQNLKEVILNLSRAWEQVTPRTVVSSSRKLWPKHLLPSELSGNEPEGLEGSLCDNVSLEVVEALAKKCGPDVKLTKQDIDDWLQSALPADDEITEEDEMTEEMETERTAVNSHDAMEALNTCVRWAEENKVSAEDMSVLKRLREGLRGKILKVKDV